MDCTFATNSALKNFARWSGDWIPFCSKPKPSFLQRQVCLISEVLGTTALITSTTEAFHSCVKFLIDFTEAVSPRFILEKLSVTVVQLDVWIDGLRFINDIKHALDLKYLTDFVAKKYALAVSGVCFFIADLGASMSLLNHFKLIPLDKIFAVLSSVRVFGQAIPKVA